ncbi:MAG: hypothetical protein R3A10_13975 [Caldilineaceae bacterium]
MQLMVIYGVWLGDQYGLGARKLGTVALVFGLFDLAASVSVSLFTGPHRQAARSVLAGVAAGHRGAATSAPSFNGLAAVAAIAVIAVASSSPSSATFPCSANKRRPSAARS